MTTFNECKEEVAKAHGKFDWFSLNEDLDTRYLVDPHYIAEAAELYARRILQEARLNGVVYVGADAYSESMQQTLADIGNELKRAKTLFPPHFVNQHEAYAVILEEVDELWTEIKRNQRDYDLVAQRKEAVQAAAMLVRLCVELLDPKH